MLFLDKLAGRARLVGIITAGGGLNLAYWIAEAKQQGYTVELAEGRALLYTYAKPAR